MQRSHPLRQSILLLSAFLCFVSLVTVVSALSPVADFTGAPSSGSVPLVVQFTDTSTNSPTGWAWFFGDENWTVPSWTQMTASAGWSARWDQSSVVLSDGSIVLMGGFGGNDNSDPNNYKNDVWRSTDKGATWAQMTASAEWSARDTHTSVAMPDGSIVLMGGLMGAGPIKNDVWRSTDKGATWTQMTPQAEWSARRFHSSVVMPDGSIVLMGGYDGNNLKNDVWRSTDNGATWTEITSNAGWSARLSQTSVTMPDGSIVLMGGVGSNIPDDYLKNDVWRSKDNGATWTEITSNAEWSGRVKHSSVVMPDGSILLVGGLGGGPIKNDVWRSTDNGATWNQITSNAGWPGRLSHTSVAMQDGSIVLMGGYGEYGNSINDVWRFMPAGSSAKNPSHTYTTQGNYTVVLQAYNDNGYSSMLKADYVTITTVPVTTVPITTAPVTTAPVTTLPIIINSPKSGDSNLKAGGTQLNPIITQTQVTAAIVIPQIKSSPSSIRTPTIPPTNVSAVVSTPPTPSSPFTSPSSSSGDFNGAMPIIVILVILLIAGGGYAIYRMKKKVLDEQPPNGNEITVIVPNTASPVSKFTPRPITLKQLPPELSDWYTDSTFIGKGGFARVFKAKRKDGKYVAIKIPIALDSATGKSFVAEIQNWTKLNHTNIVKIYDFNIMPLPYFEMELCDSSLAEMQKPIESEEAAWIIFNVCEGLKFTHALKIIHRDLKPQNILIKDGTPKISDWGLSRVITESSASTATSFTPNYAAPEQINNRVKDERTDIWQLGVIFYELVTGVLPFKGDSMIEIAMNIATKDPAPPSDITPDSREFDAIVMKCLQKDPAKRYQTVIELQKDLAAFMGIELSESLTKSMRIEDSLRSAYLCCELLQMNMKIGDIKSALKYASTLVNNTTGKNKKSVIELVNQLTIRIDSGLEEIPDELIQKTDLIVHQVRLEFGKNR